MSLEVNDVVIVEKGHHKGFLGFVDDETGEGGIIVFPLAGDRYRQGPIVVRESSLRKLTDEEVNKLAVILGD